MHVQMVWRGGDGMTRILAIDLGAESGRGVIGTLSDDRKLSLNVIHRFPNGPVKIGETLYWNTTGLVQEIRNAIRIAAEEEPKFEFYTSRLGIGYKDIVPFYRKQIQENNQVELKMLHFFINTGINDTAYYWNELVKCIKVYVALKKECPTLDSLNIGGGFPIKNSLAFEFDYQYMRQAI